MDSLQELYERLEQFRNDRDWSQFHEPKDLFLMLAGEVGELAALMRFKTEEEIYQMVDELKPEIADIFISLINFCLIFYIDLVVIGNEKIDINEARYPVEKCKGVATKAEDL